MNPQEYFSIGRSNCYFCMKKKRERLVTDKLENGELCDFWLCEDCASDKDKADKIQNGDVTDYLDKDLGPLCTKCGICCFMLHAKVTEEEADKVAKEHNVERDSFAEQTAPFLGPVKGELSIKMPCKFLIGRPLNWVGCRIHEKYRPAVCESYTCKIASRYKLGILSLGEALYWLRCAFLSRDYSIFNWVKSGDEIKVLLSSTIGSYIEHLKRTGADEIDIKAGLAHMATPRYELDGDSARFVLNMHLSVTDRGDFDPGVFMTEQELETLKSMSGVSASVFTIGKVMTTLRELFVRKSENIEEIVQVHKDRADVIQKEVEEDVRRCREISHKNNSKEHRFGKNI